MSVHTEDPRVVFIQACRSSTIPAKVARHALLTHRRSAPQLDVRFIWLEDCEELLPYDGAEMLRSGQPAWWHADAPQAFLPVRFRAPELLGFTGRCVVMDPDIFARTDVEPLFTRPFGDSAILARRFRGQFNSSVMVLDCARLEHWRWGEQIRALFAREIDFQDWLDLRLEPPGAVASLSPEWNSIDLLTRRTQMVHVSNPRTQPWKTGLPLDESRINNARRSATFDPSGTFRRNPDPLQERYFFRLLRSALEAGDLSDEELDEGVRSGWIRPDVWDAISEAQRPVPRLGRWLSTTRSTVRYALAPNP